MIPIPYRYLHTREYVETNVTRTLNFLEAGRRAAIVRRIVTPRQARYRSNGAGGAHAPSKGGGGSSSARRRWSNSRESIADQAAVFDDGYALRIVLLEEMERRLEVHVRVDRVVRLLGDLADRRLGRVATGCDHLADERLARDDPRQPAVLR